jgi:hypothetical protein
MPNFVGMIHKGVSHCRAGTVDKDIEPTESLERDGAEPRNLIRIGYIARADDSLSTQLFDFFREA